MTRFNNVTANWTFAQAMQLSPDNIEDMESFVGGHQKGTMLDRKDRVVEFWDKWSGGGQEQDIRMEEWAVKYPNGYIHVCSMLLFTSIYEV